MDFSKSKHIKWTEGKNIFTEMIWEVQRHFEGVIYGFSAQCGLSMDEIIYITWELDRNADSQAPPNLRKQTTFHQDSYVIRMHIALEEAMN